jgi:hypothetical protein
MGAMTKLADLQVGDEARGQLDGGAMVRGEIQSIEDGIVTIKGRKIPIDRVQSTEDIDRGREDNQRQLRDDLRQQQEEAKIQRPPSAVAPPPQPNQTYIDMESYVESVGCTITVETIPSFYESVVAQYEADTKRPITGPEAQNIFEIPTRMIPTEWRTVFKAPTDPQEAARLKQAYGRHVEDYASKGVGTWRINHKDFARFLIINGFVLGRNQPKQQAAPATP